MDSFIVKAVMVLVPMILSLTFHEYSHALVARWLGDRTATEQGRLTLNPIAHIDPIGTLLLPLICVATAGVGVPFFGWAKPVPYNATRFDRRFSMKTGAMLVSAAGPLSNALLAFLLTVGVGLAIRFGLPIGDAAGKIFKQMVAINVGLAIFNVIPVPPLDGAKVLAGLLPANESQAFEAFMSRIGIFVLFGLVVFGGRFLYPPMSAAIGFLFYTLLPAVAS